MTVLHANGVPLTALDLAFASFLQQAQPSADQRHLWLAALVSHQFGRSHVCLDLDQLRLRPDQTLGWEAAALALLPPGLASAASDLPWAVGPASPLVLDGARLYLRRNWQAEQAIATSIRARLALPGTDPWVWADALDSLFASTTSAPASAGPDWQKVACALAARGRFTLITGGPGTGKTTTVVRLLALLQSQASHPLRVALAAPTGKAATRLGDSMASAAQQLPQPLRHRWAMRAQTMHKLLQVRPALVVGAPSALALDLVVVDEASMIDLELMARLLAAVPLEARLVLLGDKDQLASVEAGAVMAQLCEDAQSGGYNAESMAWVRQASGQDISAWAGPGTALAQQTVMLRHSHRFAAAGLIGQWAAAVNAGDVVATQSLWERTPGWAADAASGDSVHRLCGHGASASVWSALAELARTVWKPWREKIPVGVCDDAQALMLLQAFGRFQVLCALREGPWGVHALNRLLANALGFAADGWYAGRPIMVTRNDYNLGLMNGDVGLCLPTARGLRVAFRDDAAAVRWVLPSRLDAVETVFAMTVHKSQGSEFEHVALVLPDHAVAVLNRELLYTGITRAKAQLTLVLTQQQVLYQAVTQKVWRSGGLSSALWSAGNMTRHEN